MFGALSLLLAALFVLRQESYKRLLAYSSIEHIGVIALGIGFGTPLAVVGALLHVINHGAAKGLAFFGAGSILRKYETKQIALVGDAVRVLPWTGPMFLFAALALSGLPVSGGVPQRVPDRGGGIRASRVRRCRASDRACEPRILRRHLACGADGAGAGGRRRGSGGRDELVDGGRDGAA